MDTSLPKREHTALASFLELSPDAVAVVDREGVVVDANAGLEELTGHPRASLLGMRVEDLVPERLRADHVHLRSGFQDRPTMRPMGLGRDLWLLREDGAEVAVDIALRPLPDGERVAAVIRDVTVARAMRERLAEAEGELRRTNDRLRAANTALGEAADFQRNFVSASSHELRTPLTAMTGFAELLVNRWDDVDDATKKSAAAAILRNASRQLALVEDLAHASHLQSGRLQLDTKDVLVGEALQEALDSVVGSEAFEVVGETAITVRADQARLIQVLVNLLTNALRYGAAPYLVEVTHDGEDMATVAVVDHGPGVPEAFVPLLFEAFSRATASGNGTSEGTGLGLYISASLAQAMGGDLRHSRGAGGGARFELHLPLP